MKSDLDALMQAHHLDVLVNFGAARVQSSRVVNTKGKAALPPRLHYDQTQIPK